MVKGVLFLVLLASWDVFAAHEPAARELQEEARVLMGLRSVGVARAAVMAEFRDDVEEFERLVRDKGEAGKAKSEKWYRKLSMKYHPDKHPDDPVFYNALNGQINAVRGGTAVEDLVAYAPYRYGGYDWTAEEVYRGMEWVPDYVGYKYGAWRRMRQAIQTPEVREARAEAVAEVDQKRWQWTDQERYEYLYTPENTETWPKGRWAAWKEMRERIKTPKEEAAWDKYNATKKKLAEQIGRLTRRLFTVLRDDKAARRNIRKMLEKMGEESGGWNAGGVGRMLTALANGDLRGAARIAKRAYGGSWGIGADYTWEDFVGVDYDGYALEQVVRAVLKSSNTVVNGNIDDVISTLDKELQEIVEEEQKQRAIDKELEREWSKA